MVEKMTKDVEEGVNNFSECVRDDFIEEQCDQQEWGFGSWRRWIISFQIVGTPGIGQGEGFRKHDGLEDQQEALQTLFTKVENVGNHLNR